MQFSDDQINCMQRKMKFEYGYCNHLVFTTTIIWFSQTVSNIMLMKEKNNYYIKNNMFPGETYYF